MKLFTYFHPSQERAKNEDKFRAQYRREANNEIKKNRSEASALVLEKFDVEEAMVQTPFLSLLLSFLPSFRRTMFSTASLPQPSR